MNKSRYSFSEFQMYCNKCFEILYQGTFMIALNEEGLVTHKEVNRIFSLPYFTEIIICPCCFGREFGRSYNVEIPKVDDLNPDYLPF